MTLARKFLAIALAMCAFVGLSAFVFASYASEETPWEACGMTWTESLADPGARTACG